MTDTWKVTVWGIIVTAAAHILFRGLSILVTLFLPVLILELAVYWITLRDLARLTRAKDRALEAAKDAGQVMTIEPSEKP